MFRYLFIFCLIPSILFAQEIFYETENWRIMKMNTNPSNYFCTYISSGSDFVLNIEETTNPTFNIMVRHKKLTNLPFPPSTTLGIKLIIGSDPSIEMIIPVIYVSSEFLLITLENTDELKQALLSAKSVGIFLSPDYGFEIPIEDGIVEAQLKAKDCVKYGGVETNEANLDNPLQNMHDMKDFNANELASLLKPVDLKDIATYSWIFSVDKSNYEIQQFGFKSKMDNFYTSMVSMNVPPLGNPEELLEQYKNIQQSSECILHKMDIIHQTSIGFIIHYGSTCKENSKDYYTMGYMVFIAPSQTAHEIVITGYSDKFNLAKDQIIAIEEQIKALI